MTRVKVFAGDCGFSAIVQADKINPSTVSVVIQSPCEMLKALSNALSEVDYRQVCTAWIDCAVFVAANRHIPHNDCPVPSVVVKAIAVEMGAAQPRDVVVSFERECIQMPYGLNPLDA